MTLLRALVVAAGGTLGVAARLLLEILIPDAGGIPIAIFTANITGSLLLGVLIARMPDPANLRLFLGTGLLGGFTTYSAFTLDTVELWQRHPLLGLGYALLSLALGLAVAVVGLRLGRPRAFDRLRDRPTQGRGAS